MMIFKPAEPHCPWDACCFWWQRLWWFRQRSERQLVRSGTMNLLEKMQLSLI